MKKLFDMVCDHCGLEKEVWVKYEDLQYQTCDVCDNLLTRKLSAPMAMVYGVGAYKPSQR